jgi:hypothetical protein
MTNSILTHFNRATKDDVIAMFLSESELVNIYFTIDSGRVATRSKIDTLTKVLHPCVVLGNDRYGQTWVAHNHIDNKRPIFETLDSYSLGQKVYWHDRQTIYTNMQIVDRAIEEVLAGQRYHPLNYNCQTFVNMITGDNHRSESVEDLSDWAIGGGFFLGLLGLAFDNKTLKAIGGSAIVAGGAAKAYSRYDRG